MLSQLDGLLTSGDISRDTWQAGDDFRRHYEHAFSGLTGSGGLTGIRADHADRFLINHLDAVTWVRQVSRTLGEPWISLVERCVVQDASWRATGRAFGISDKTARERTVDALGRLAKVSPLR